jgi:hypothetical protein
MAFLELGLQVINPEIVSESPEGQLGGLSREGGKRSSDLA